MVGSADSSCALNGRDRHYIVLAELAQRVDWLLMHRLLLLNLDDRVVVLDQLGEELDASRVIRIAVLFLLGPDEVARLYRESLTTEDVLAFQLPHDALVPLGAFFFAQHELFPLVAVLLVPPAYVFVILPLTVVLGGIRAGPFDLNVRTLLEEGTQLLREHVLIESLGPIFWHFATNQHVSALALPAASEIVAFEAGAVRVK